MCLDKDLFGYKKAEFFLKDQTLLFEMLKVSLTILIVAGLFSLGSGDPGIPGKAWSKKNMLIIRNKLRRLWQFPEAYIAPFDKWYYPNIPSPLIKKQKKYKYKYDEDGKRKPSNLDIDRFYNQDGLDPDVNNTAYSKTIGIMEKLHLPMEVRTFGYDTSKEFLHDSTLAQEYLYDPNTLLDKADCDIQQEANCGGWFNDDWRRSEDYAFTERKMLRLA